MKATLYKLKEGWVLCSDEEVNDKDLVISLNPFSIFVCKDPAPNKKKEFKKVLTQSPDLSSLSPDKQKEIGWFDYSAFSDSFTNQVEDSLTKTLLSTAMRAAYLKALELTADRRFTEDDMISFGKQCFYNGFNKCKNDDANSFTSWREIGGILIKNIQQPKSWEVEAEEIDGVYKVLSIV